MKDFSDEFFNLLPSSPAVLHILIVLSSGPMHGYGIMQEVDRISHRKVKMGPGTLYGTIKRMLRDNLIEEASQPGAVEADDERKRRYYQLTEIGRKVLSAEAERLASLMVVIREKVPMGKSDASIGYPSGT